MLHKNEFNFKVNVVNETKQCFTEASAYTHTNLFHMVEINSFITKSNINGKKMKGSKKQFPRVTWNYYEEKPIEK